MSEERPIPKNVEEAAWTACAATGRVLHTLHLIRLSATSESQRADLLAELPARVEAMREACWKVELATDRKPPA